MLTLNNDPAHGDALLCWVGSLAALGYPPRWVMARAGQRRYTRSVLNGVGVPAATVDAVREVFLDYRDQPAEVAARTGLSPAQIRRARAYAEEYGWRTPDWYGKDGRMISGRRYEQRVANRNKLRRAFNNIEMLRLILNGLGNPQIAERTGHDVRTVNDLRALTGMTGFYDGGTWFPDRKSRPRFKEIERALDGYYRSPGADPHVVLVTLGITQDRGFHRYVKAAS